MSERDHTPEPAPDAILATLLREEADRASDGILPPPLEDLQRRAATRRRRPWLIAGGVLAAAAVVGAVIWASLPAPEGAGPAGGSLPPADGPIASTFPVPTHEWSEGGGDSAQVSGVLALTDAGCPLLVAEGSATALILPDATGVTYDNGVRGVVDAQGRVYGVEGQTMEYGGGWLEPVSGQLAADWEALCGDTPARDAIVVSSVAAHAPLTEAPPPPTEDLPTAPSTAEELGWFPVPTYEFDLEAPRQGALIEGVVRFTDEGCPFVEADGMTTGLVFPNAEGWRAPGTDDPRIVYAYFSDGSMGMMAEEGQSISWGGGGASDEELWTSVCSAPVDSIFVVQDTPFG